MSKKQKDYIISNKELENNRKKIIKSEKDKRLDKNLKRLALEKFDEARFSPNKQEAYEKAIEAYEIYPSDYQYKTFAISKIDDCFERERLYKQLIDLVELEIYNSIDGLYEFYDQSEVNSFRFKDLKYRYIICLILNKKYEMAYEELILFENKYSYIDFKVKHLILNLCILLKKYNEFIKQYNSIYGNENILYKLPLTYVLFKNGNFESAKSELLRVQELNIHIYDILVQLENENVKKEIFRSKHKYKIGTRGEAMYCLKFFNEIYNDTEFKEFILKNKR